MKIGITERNDAGINFEWVQKIDEIDGMILITKNISIAFREIVLKLYRKGYKIILHCTCTGFGGTELEPYVPDYKSQLNALKSLIENGFPAENCVLRIDPIFPSEKGLRKVKEVLDYFMALNTGVTRIRVSIVDEYKHVKERYKKLGWNPLYGDKFGPSASQIHAVAAILQNYPFTFETCAESGICDYSDKCKVQGCISNVDLKIMGLPEVSMSENPQNRRGCHCLSCKTELFTKRKQCPNGCVYCYWKD